MGSTERIRNVAKRVAKWARAGHQMVVVPSAMSGETNRLLALAKAYNLPDRRSTLPEMLTFGDNAKGAPNLGNRSALPDMERLVRDYGYSGYLTGAGKQRAAAVYDPVENLRAILRGDKGYAAGGRVKSETPCGCS